MRRQVIDVDSLVKYASKGTFNSAYINEMPENSTTFGKDAYDFVSSLKKSTNLNGSASYKMGLDAKIVGDAKGGGIFTGSLSKKSETKDSYLSVQSYMQGYFHVRYKKLTLYVKPSDCFKYLMPTFKKDLDNMSPAQLVKEYGTHIMLDIELGGKLSAIYRSTIGETMSYAEKEKTMKAGLSAGFKGFGIQFGDEETTTETTLLNKKNDDWSFNLTIMGGSTNGQSYQLNSQGGYTIDFKVNDWSQSIDDKRAKLIDINWDRTYPIYEFIPDPIKKEKVRVAVNEYIYNKRINVVDVLPLYEYNNVKLCDHYTSTNNDTHIRWGHEGYFKSDPWLIGYVYKSEEPGTVPLYEYNNIKLYDHYTTTDAKVETDSGQIGYFKNGSNWITGYVIPANYKE